MMRAFLLTAALVAAPFSLKAQETPTFTPYDQMPAGVYELDKNHASLLWRVSHAGLMQYTARFKDFDAKINFNPQSPEKSHVEAKINPLSVETDFVATPEKDFNQNLATGEQWFNGVKFPQISFKTDSFEITGENTGKLTGTLSMLGVEKPVILDVKLNGAYAMQPFSQKPTMGFSATSKILRSEWGMDTYVPMIGDEVEIIIEGEFAKND